MTITLERPQKQGAMFDVARFDRAGTERLDPVVRASSANARALLAQPLTSSAPPMRRRLTLLAPLALLAVGTGGAVAAMPHVESITTPLDHTAASHDASQDTADGTALSEQADDSAPTLSNSGGKHRAGHAQESETPRTTAPKHRAADPVHASTADPVAVTPAPQAAPAAQAAQAPAPAPAAPAAAGKHAAPASSITAGPKHKAVQPNGTTSAPAPRPSGSDSSTTQATTQSTQQDPLTGTVDGVVRTVTDTVGTVTGLVGAS